MKVLKYKKIKNKYRVYFDNDIKVYWSEDIILKYELLLKKEIDSNTFDKLVLDNNKEDIYEKSLNYISIKIRSREEIYNYLNKKGYEKEDIVNTINRLEKNNLINDDLYIKSYIHDKFYLSSDGLNKIKKYLKFYHKLINWWGNRQRITISNLWLEYYPCRYSTDSHQPYPIWRYNNKFLLLRGLTTQATW